MASFTAKDVQALREQTGVGMMDCKNALSEADGNFEKAVELLREKGLAAAAKKAGRIAAEGMVTALVIDGAGAIIEVNSETDFVAKNESFRAFVELSAKTVVEEAPADVDSLLKCKAPSGTIEDELREKILTIGENIKIRRFERYEGVLTPYIHGGGTHAVIVKFNTGADTASREEFALFAKDIAMQIAAANPRYVDKSEVPSDEIEKEREILLAQALNEGKPQNIAEKMVAGRVNKYYKDIVLLEQPFVKDDKMSVAQYVANTAKSLSADIAVTAFTRYEKGEGLEKRNENFAEEIANMQK
ncbi:MAG: translation elongation factor Ts [Oscillospiraceae bacterium]|nr:translation elongation factor Ts [Oscillospiraceae bacterium]